MKRWIAMGTALLLLCSLLLPIGHAEAAAARLRILEITDQEQASTIAGVLDAAKYEITTLSMKEFTASREELDGRYDAIYVAKGTYATTLPTLDPNPYAADPNKLNASLDRKMENKTQTRMNDITPLKAEEIRKSYINKGLPVIAHTDVLSQTCGTVQLPGQRCVLKTLFAAYQTNPKPNVYLIGSTASFPSLSLQRPRMQLIEKPVDYEKDQTHVYQAGDKLTFSFSLSAGNESTTTAALYMDTNFNSIIEPTERLASYPLSSIKQGGTYTISYKLPRSFSAIRMWKLEISNQKDLKDYETGVVRFQDESVDIRVLQVTSDKNYTGSLLKTLNTILTNGSSTIQSEDYKIKIDVTDMDTFNSCVSAGKPCYKDLNAGTYNMVIFGFQDEYGSRTASKLSNPDAISSIGRFVETGQSIFLTHDTLYRPLQSGSSTNLADTNVWFTTLMPYSGQTYPIAARSNYATASMSEKVKTPGRYFLETNIGRYARVTVTGTKQANKGMVTLYPYKLNYNVPIAMTHSQYFALDVNDPDVMPWYNLDSGTSASLDNNDSYNHYYIYSRKNITYTGAGHTSNSFRPEEQQLFVNTMFTAFAGANHAPIITVYAPAADGKVLTTQQVNISFKVEDLDAKDRILQTNVYFNDRLVYTNDGVASGETINQLLGHEMTASGPLTVRIEAFDAAGAKTVQTIALNVEKPATKVTATRFASTTNIIPVNAPVTIQYAVKPITIQSLRPFVLGRDTIDWLKAQTAATVPYSTFAAPNVGFLQFSNSPDTDVKTGYPKPVSGADFAGLKWALSGTGAYTKSLQEYVGAQGKVDIEVPVVNNVTLQQQSTLQAFAKLRLEAVDSANVKVTFLGFVEDGFTSLTDTAFEEVFPPYVDVKIPDEWKSKLTKSGSLTSGYKVSGSFGTLAKQTSGYPVADLKFQLQVIPTKKGQYALNWSTFQYKENKEAAMRFEDVSITAKEPLQSVDAQDELSLTTLSTPQKVLLQFNPSTAVEDGTIRSIVWSDESKNGVISIDSEGVVTPLQPGNAVVKVKVTDIFGNVREDTATVLVRVPVLSITAPEEVIVNVGETASLQVTVNPGEARNTLEWKVDQPELISFNRDRADVTGREPGTAIVTLTGYDQDGNPVERQVRVIVKQPVQSIAVQPAELELTEGDTYLYEAGDIRILPDNASNKNVTWTSDASQYVEAGGDSGSGTIRAIKSTNGSSISVRITAQDGSGVQAVIKVRVRPRYTPLTGISLPGSVMIEKGSTLDLSSLLVFQPANATKKEVVWEVNDRRFVLVSEAGIASGLAKGYATVTATSKDGGHKATVVVQVIEKGTGTNPGSGNAPLFRW